MFEFDSRTALIIRALAIGGALAIDGWLRRSMLAAHIMPAE
ncbi:MAG: hypothetical protein O3A85_14555 [Proteobacteria bacterium]|nr:hypothetical protein [Pseudomonadota bacterium]